MRALGLFSRLVNWRWMPAVGLVVGSLLFVLLAVVLIPDELFSSSAEPTDASRLVRSHGLARFAPTTPNRPRMVDDSTLFGTKAPESESPRGAERDVVQSIFHPVSPTELPVAPPDPDPPPPPEPPPAPPPATTIFTLENPPPPPPNPGAVEPPPEAASAPGAPAEAPAPPPEAAPAPAEAPAETGETPPGEPAPP